MAGKTKYTEDLVCIALSYLSLYPDSSKEDFYKFIQSPGLLDWNKVLNNCQLIVTNNADYQKKFKGEDEWVYGSFLSALSIKENLNLNLSNYIFCGVSPNTKGAKNIYGFSDIGNILKTKAASTIAKLYKFRTGKTDNIIAKLNADKLNISDIFLCAKPRNTDLYNFLKLINASYDLNVNTKLIKDTLKSLVGNPNEVFKYKNNVISKYDLNIEKYVGIMNDFYVKNNVIGISLKKISNSAKNYRDVPYAILGSDSKLPTETSEDKFFQFVALLIKLSKNKTFNEFEEEINKFITFNDDVQFTTKDQLYVNFSFNYGNKSSPYRIFTNFGSKNNFYFQPINATGYHEGGITIERFIDMTYEYPSVVKLFKNMANKREEYFNSACESYGLSAIEVYRNKNISSTYRLSNTNKLIYSSTKYEKFISLILNLSRGQSKIDIASNIENEKNKYMKVMSGKLVVKGKTSTNSAQRYYKMRTENIEVKYAKILTEFYDKYTKYLSNGSDMGKFGSLKSGSRKEMEKNVEKIKNAKNVNEFRNMSKSAVLNFSKSYALLTNAEFGYIFTKHNREITELIKKKMILSLYSLATGRGFITFKGEKYKLNNIFIEDFRTPRYVKIGN